MTDQIDFAFMAHPCGLARTYCDDCAAELEAGQTGQCSECEPKVRTFDELSDIEKDAARNAHRYSEHYLSHDWWEYDEFENVGVLLGIEISTQDVKLISGKTRQKPDISFSGFSSQGDGACFEGTYSCEADATKKIAEHAPQDSVLAGIAAQLQAVQVLARMRWGETLSAKMTTSGRYSHSGSMNVELMEVESLEFNENDQPFREAEETITQCMRDFADWIYSQLNDQYDHLMSDECVDQCLVEEKFDEDGEVI